MADALRRPGGLLEDLGPQELAELSAEPEGDEKMIVICLDVTAPSTRRPMDSTNSKLACSRAISAPPSAPRKSLMRPAGSAPKIGFSASVPLSPGRLVTSEKSCAQHLCIGEGDRADLRFGLVAAAGGLDAQLRQAECAHDHVGAYVDALDPGKRDRTPLLDEDALDDEEVVADYP